MMMLFLMPLRVPLCSRAPSPLFVVAVLTLMCMMMVVVPGVDAAEENFTDENYTRIENNTLYVVDCSLPPTTTLNATFYSTELLVFNVSFEFLNCGTIQQRGLVRILGRYEAVWNDVHVLIRNCVVNNRRGFNEPLPAELDRYWQLTQSSGRLFYAFTTIWTIGQYNNVSLRVESSKVNATSLFVARGMSQNHLRIEVIDSSTNCAHPTFWVISPISGSLLYVRNANLTILRSFVFTRIESRYWLINAGGLLTLYANYLSDFYVQTIDSNFSLQFNITEGVLADVYEDITVMAGIMLAQSAETEFHRVALDSLNCNWTLQSGPVENYEWDRNGVGHANPTQVYVFYLTTGLSAAYITATNLSFRIRGGSLALSSTAGSHGMYLNRLLVDHLRIHVSNINHVQIVCSGVISKLTPQRTGSLLYLRGLTKPTGIVVVEVHDLPNVVILVTSGSIDVDSPSAQYPIHSTSKGIGIMQPQAVQLATAQLVIFGSLIGTPGTVSTAVRQVHPWNCQSVFDSPSWTPAIVSICNISMRAEVQNGTFTGRPSFFLAPGMMFSRDTPLPAITLSIAALRLEQDARASVIVRDVYIRLHDVHVDGIIGVVVADLVFPGQMPAAIDVFVTTITALIIHSVDTNDTFVSITNSSLETMPMQTTMPLPIRTYSPLFQNVSDNFFRYPLLHGFNASGIVVAQDPSSLMSTFVIPLIESNPFLSGQASQLPFSTLTLCRVNFSFQNVEIRSPFLAGEIQRTSFEAQAATFVAPFVATKLISIIWHPLAALLVPSSSMLGTQIEMIRCSHVSARPVAVIGSIAPLHMAASRSADGVLHPTLISIIYGNETSMLFNDDQPALGLSTTPLNFGPHTELRLQHVTMRNKNNNNNIGKNNNASFVPSNVVFSPSPPSLVVLNDSLMENFDSFFPQLSRSRVWQTVSGFQLGCNAFLPPLQRQSLSKYIALEDRGAVGAAPRQTIHFPGNILMAGRGLSTAVVGAPSSLVCTGRLYPVLTETETLTLLPPPQPPGSPLSKTSVSSVALSGAVVLAALHAMPSFIPAMQRSALVMRCLRPSATEEDQAATEPGMLISDSPTQLQIAFKDPQMAFVRGTVVGNLILWGVVFTLQIGIGLFATRNAPHSGGWRSFSRFPGSWVFPYSILAQPTLASAVQLLVDREAPAMDVSIGLVGLLASLWPPLWYGWFVIAAYASWPSRRPPMGWWAVFRPPLWCRGATTKQGESVATVFLTKMPAKLSILRRKRQRRKMGLLRELWDVIARDRYEWRPLRKCPQFFATYGMLFEGYRQHQQWFFLIEFGILLAGGFASGLATPDSCDSFQGTFLVIAGVQFFSGLLFLPFVSVLADLVFILNALLSFVTSQLAVLDDVVAAQYAALAQGIIGIVLILPLFIAHYERIWQSVQRAIVFLRVHAGCADPDSGKEGDDESRRTKAGGTSASQSSSDTDGGESGRSTAQQRRRKQRATKLLPVTPPAATTAAAPSAVLPPALLRQWQRTPLRSTHEKLQRLQLLVEAACASSPPPPPPIVVKY